MPTRPDLRDITTGVRDALGDTDRDALLEILTFLIKEYVVDGPPPMLLHQAETIADLNRLSFAQLIASLQTRLDLPELSLFAVDGEQVSVRVGGAMHPLTPGRAGAPASAELPRPSAGVRVVETTVSRPPQAAPQAPQAGTQTERGTAPPPSRGLSLRGAPAAEGQPVAGPPSGATSTTPPAPAPAAPAAPSSSSGDKAEGGGDDASARFSLLELD